MQKQKHRLLALLLVFVLMLQVFPLMAFAEEDSEVPSENSAEPTEEPSTQKANSEESTPSLSEEPSEPEEPAEEPVQEEPAPEESVSEELEPIETVTADADLAEPAELPSAQIQSKPMVGDNIVVYQWYDPRVHLKERNADGFPYLTTYNRDWVGGSDQYPSSSKYGTLLYCLQYYSHGNGNAGTSTTTTDLLQTPAWTNLSKAARKGITYTLVYGVPNCDSYYDNIYGYAATQILIWEYQLGKRTLPSDNVTFFNATLNSSSQLRGAYNAILTNLRNHYIVPSFDGTNVELQGVGQRSSYTLTDTNGSLSAENWNMSVNNQKYSVTRNGNKLTIYAKEYTKETCTVTLTRKLPCATGTALCAKTGDQSCITGVPEDPVSVTFTIKMTATGEAKLTKITPAGMGKKDFVFKVYEGYTDLQNGKVFATMTTDSNGKAGVANLIPGKTYYVLEDVPPECKQKPEFTVSGVANCGLSGSAAWFTAEAGKTVEIRCTNDWNYGSAKITKVTDEQQNVPNITFTIYEGWDHYSAGVKFDEVKTDGVGEANVVNLKPNYSYYVVETIPVGYSKLPDWTITGSDDWKMSIGANGERIAVFKAKAGTQIGILCTNHMTISGEIRKVSESAHLDGYRYKFYTYGGLVGERNFYGISAKDGRVYMTDDTYTEPAERKYNFTGFRDGIAMDGKYKFLAMMETLSEKDYEAGLMPVSWYIRVDNADGKTVFEHTYYARENGNDVGIFADPDNANTYRIEVIVDQSVGANPFVGLNEGGSITMEIDNEYVTFPLELLKQDSTDGKPLPGAEFTIYDATGKKLTKLTDNHDGSYLSDGLRPGSYTVVETKAPDGYILDSTPHKVTVTRNGIETDLPLDRLTNKPVVTNEPILGKIEVDKTDEGGQFKEGVGFLLEWQSADGWKPVVPADEKTTGKIGTCTGKELSSEGVLLTDQQGKAIFTDLRVYDEHGEQIRYRLTEISTVDGLSLMAEPVYEGPISENSEENEYHLYLTVVDSGYMLPMTGSTGFPTVTISILMMGAALAVFFAVRKKNENTINE